MHRMEGETVSATDIRERELERLAGFGIHPIRVVVRRGWPVAYIDQETADRILDMEREWKALQGKFIVPGRYTIPKTDIELPISVAIDNDGGYCFVEEFYHESAALTWVSDGTADTDRAHLRDAQRLEREINLFCPLGSPHRTAVVEWLTRMVSSWD